MHLQTRRPNQNNATGLNMILFAFLPFFFLFSFAYLFMIKICWFNDYYKCLSTGECYSVFQSCNGFFDCEDGSDEIDCACPLNHLRCKRGRCLENFYLCDQIIDCPLGDDEVNCSKCNFEEVKCIKENKCIKKNQLCDRIVDCSNGDDERICGSLMEDQSVLVRYKGKLGLLCDSKVKSLKRKKRKNELKQKNESIKILHSQICIWNKYNSKSFLKIKKENWTEKLYFTYQIHRSKKGNVINFLETKPCPDNLFKTFCNKHKCGKRLITSENTTYPFIPSRISPPSSSSSFASFTSLLKGFHSSNDSLFSHETSPKPILSPLSSFYILNGQASEVGQWPSYVLLIYQNKPFCGGVLISEEWGITAAHCLKPLNNKEVIVRAGGVRINGDYEVEKKIDRMIIHPNYSSNFEDIALFKFDKPLSFSSKVQSACIPNFLIEQNTFRVCFVVGHGMSSKRIMNNALLFGRISLYETSSCISSKIYDKKKMICLSHGDNTKSFTQICKGDSGGPVLCSVDMETWFVVGINSFVLGLMSKKQEDLCRESFATRINYHLSWVTQNSGIEPVSIA